jgi:hypothetical protein
MIRITRIDYGPGHPARDCRCRDADPYRLHPLAVGAIVLLLGGVLPALAIVWLDEPYKVIRSE